MIWDKAENENNRKEKTFGLIIVEILAAQMTDSKHAVIKFEFENYVFSVIF